MDFWRNPKLHGSVGSFPSSRVPAQVSTQADRKEHLKPGPFLGTYSVPVTTKCGENRQMILRNMYRAFSFPWREIQPVRLKNFPAGDPHGERPWDGRDLAHSEKGKECRAGMCWVRGVSWDESWLGKCRQDYLLRWCSSHSGWWGPKQMQRAGGGSQVALAARWCGPRETESQPQGCLLLAVEMRANAVA